jgi:hypothetical protein
MIAATLRVAQRSTQKRLVRTLRPQLPEATVNLKGLAIDIAEHHVIILMSEKGDRKGWKAARQFRDAYEDLAARHEAKGRLKEAAEARERALFHASAQTHSPDSPVIAAPSRQSKPLPVVASGPGSQG